MNAFLLFFIFSSIYAIKTPDPDPEISFDVFGYTKLHQKCLKGQLLGIQTIIKNFNFAGSINLPDKTTKKLPLHILIEKADDINAKPPPSEIGEDGKPPSAPPNVVEIVKALVAMGSSLTAQTDSGWTAINLAVYMASIHLNYPLEIIDALLAHPTGCAAVKIETHQQTALHFAASSRLPNNRSKILVEKLIKACHSSINYLSINADGWTALKVSMAVGNTETINVLKDVTPSMSPLIFYGLIGLTLLLAVGGLGLYYYYINHLKDKKFDIKASPVLQIPEEVLADNNDSVHNAEVIEGYSNVPSYESENEVRRTSGASAASSTSTTTSPSSAFNGMEDTKKMN